MCGGRGGGRICGHIVIADKAPGAHDATMSSYPTRRVAALGFPEAQLLDIAGPLEVFSRASRLLSREGRGPPAYVVELLAHKAGPVVTSSGLALVAARAFSDVRGGLDTLVVSGGRGTDLAVRDRSLIAWLRRMAPPRVRRLASVCTGAFILAEAGLLDGKRVTTHWASCARLARQYPRLSVEPDPIFIQQGSVYTSAGVTSGMDLALSLVAEDHGITLAREVARQLVLFLHRPGGQSQFSTQLEEQLSDHPRIADLQAWMADHLEEDLSVEALASRAAMSPRNFARVFTRTMGQTPARRVEQLRVEAARRRLKETSEGVSHTIVNGQILLEDRKHTGALPGRVLRSYEA